MNSLRRQKMNKRLLYCNISFDLVLADRFEARFAPAVAEATLYFLFIGSRQDIIMLDCQPGPGYFEYLESCGLELPRPLDKQNFSPELVPYAWGWNSEAVSRFHSLGLDTSFPSIEVVRLANCRSFSFKIGKKYGLGVPDALQVDSSDHLRQLLPGKGEIHKVLKPLFGNAGNGFIHFSSTQTSGELEKLVRVFFDKGPQGGILEPWLEKIYDVSARFVLDGDNTIKAWNFHQTLNNSSGNFYGIYLEPTRTRIQKWQDALYECSTIVAEELFRIGYFGPVGIDGLVFRDHNNNEALVPLLEINARHSMSSIAYHLAAKLGPDRHCLFLLGPGKKYIPLTYYTELSEKLDGLMYDEKNKCGVVMLTPLCLTFSGRQLQPRRAAFFIIANNRDDLLKMDEILRQKLQKKPHQVSYQRYLS